MTREEAVYRLNALLTMCDFRDAFGDRVDSELYEDAVAMAIEALSDVPDTNFGKWSPITSRPMDEEEREEWSDRLGYELDDEEAVMYCSPLPDYGQEVLICSKYGHIAMDTFYQDECGCYFEDNGDMDGIIAWMPLPSPYKGEEE